jgi:hypothetical protein
MLLAAIVLVLAQAGIGMAVNLYATVPPRHPGAAAGDYFRGLGDRAAPPSQCQDRVSLTTIWPPSITQAWLVLPAWHCHR